MVNSIVFFSISCQFCCLLLCSTILLLAPSVNRNRIRLGTSWGQRQRMSGCVQWATLQSAEVYPVPSMIISFIHPFILRKISAKFSSFFPNQSKPSFSISNNSGKKSLSAEQWKFKATLQGKESLLRQRQDWCSCQLLHLLGKVRKERDRHWIAGHSLSPFWFVRFSSPFLCWIYRWSTLQTKYLNVNTAVINIVIFEKHFNFRSRKGSIFPSSTC